MRSKAASNLWVLLAILAAAAAPGFAQPAPGPFDRTWDWAPDNAGMVRRDLKLCIEQNTPAMIAGAARFGATTLNNANLGWKIEEITIFGIPIPCPGNWSLRNNLAANGGFDIRVRVENLGPLAAMPAGPHPPYPHDVPIPHAEENPYPSSWPDRMPGPNDPPRPGMPGPMPGGGAGPGGRPRFVQPPLAYFQPGVLRGGRFIEAAEVVFNWRPGMGGVDPKWNTAIGSDTFDPREVAMHELGHAIRFLHDDFLFDDDITVFPTGSMPGANVTILTSGRDRNLQTVRLADDVIACGDINAGPDGVADSGKKTNVMETFAVKGRHGINPGAGVPAGSRYRFTDREQQTGLAAKAHIPPRPMPPAGGRGMQVAAGNARTQQWGSLTLLDDVGMPVASYSPGLVANDESMDFIVHSIPPASSFRGTLTASSPELAGMTQVEIFADLGGASPGTTARVQVWIPFSPSHSHLEVHADWASDQVWITDGATVLCDGYLSEFHPVDCWIDPAGPEFHSVGIIVVDLTTPASGGSSTDPKP